MSRLAEARQRLALASSDPYLKKRYDYFNKLLFNGELPEIPVVYSLLKTCGGQACCKTRMDPASGKKIMSPGSLIVKITSLYERDAKSIDQILIHEMIHVHFMAIGDLKETHGYKFNAMRFKLGKIVGFDIPRFDKVDGLEMTVEPTKPIGMILPIQRKSDNRQCFALVSVDYLRKNMDTLRRRFSIHSQFSEVRFIITYGQIEKQYKIQRSDKLKLYYVKDQAVFDEAIAHGKVVATIPILA